MTVVRRVARPMLAAIFVTTGLDALKHPAKRAEMAAPLVNALAGPLHLPNDPELLVRANGAAMLAAGSLFGVSKLPRLSSLVLAATMVPTTYAGHAFWEEKDKAQRAQQRTQFLKNLGLIGGLLLASVDTAGQPGLAWRAQHGAAGARRGVERGVEQSRREARHLAKTAKRETRHAAKAARREAKLAAVTAHDRLT